MWVLFTKGKSGISEAEREEKIQKAQQKAQNSKPGSLASKANLVSRYNSGQQTNQPKAEDESSSKGKRARKNKGRFVTPNRSLKKQETGQDLKMEESG